MNPNPSPDLITSLKPNEVFVYGANEAGIHGAGAAKQAMEFGAVWGKYGRSGQSYGIPTKNKRIETLSINEIQDHVIDFLLHSGCEKETTFLVTAIGTGLAGFEPRDIAWMFLHSPDNVLLPKSFLTILNQ